MIWAVVPRVRFCDFVWKVAVTPLNDSLTSHRNVQAVEQHERGGRLWLALI